MALAQARWVIFYSFGSGIEEGLCYDAHKIEHMRHELAFLAYEMNGEPLNVLHGAPPRLRNELELGFKQVKWIQAIEFAESRPPWRPGPPRAPGTRPGRQPAGGRSQPGPRR